VIDVRARHLAFISLYQFDLHLRDGASWDILTRLQYLQTQGHGVSLLSFPAQDYHANHLTAAIADGGRLTSENGNVIHARFKGLDYYQEILPHRLQQINEFHQQILKILVLAIRRAQVDFLFTADEEFLPLLAAWLLAIPGAHCFFSQDNVRSFAQYPRCVRFLKSRPVYANSQFIQSEIKSRLGLDSTVWYPCLDFERYKVGPKKQRTRRIGFCAKGQEVGNELVTEVARRQPERTIIVVGDHYHPSDSLPENISWWGHIPEMKRFYKEIDLLLVPSSREAFSRVILEAAVNGIPAIANRVGGIPEAVGDGGILIDIEQGKDGEFDTISMAEKYVLAIRRLLDDDKLYADYSRRASARAAAYQAMQAEMARSIYQADILPALSSMRTK
jgi:glycosyltransferase involved in cell wall biosynthesis